MKSLQLGVCMGRVKEIFWPNPPWWVKKYLIQPNPTHMDRVRSGWTHELEKFIIIIKLSRKKYKYKYIKKTQILVSM